MMSRRG
jgi:hypothetical protein